MFYCIQKQLVLLLGLLFGYFLFSMHFLSTTRLHENIECVGLSWRRMVLFEFYVICKTIH